MAKFCKLLIVDDEPDICDLIQAYLAEQGFAVDCATDADTARRSLKAQAYDLVLLDILMPGKGGLELAGLADRREIAVLLMSGQPELINEISRLSSYPLLAKPFHLKELTAAVRAVLETRAPVAP